MKGLVLQNEKSNSNTILSSSQSPMNNNNFVSSSVNGFPNFKLDLKNKLKLDKEKLAGSDLCSERTSHNNSIISKALNGNPGGNLVKDKESYNKPKENIAQSTATLNPADKGKKLQTTYSNFFRKSNVGNSMNTKSFFVNPNGNNDTQHPKENHTVMTINRKNIQENESSKLWSIYSFKFN